MRIFLDRVDVGRHAKIRRAIIDKDVRIPAGFTVGDSHEDDARRFTVSESCVVVIARGEQIDKEGLCTRSAVC